MEYTPFLYEHGHALARAKHEVAFLETSIEKQKANMSDNGKSFKSMFPKVSRIIKELNDASMSEYKKRTDSI